MDPCNDYLFSSPDAFWYFDMSMSPPLSVPPLLTIGNFEPELEPIHPTIDMGSLDVSPSSHSSTLPDLYWSDHSSTASPTPVDPAPLPSPRPRAKVVDDEFIPDQDTDEDDDDEYNPSSSSNPRKAGPSRKTKSKKTIARPYFLETPSHASSPSPSSSSSLLPGSSRASPSRKPRKSGPNTRVEAPNRNRTANDEEWELLTSMIARLSKDKASRGDPSKFRCPLEDCPSSSSKAMMRAPDMKRHLKTHFGEKPFSCAACGKTFSRMDAVNRHLKNVKNVYCSKKLNSAAA